jgi:peptidoglycan hydrolase CwlO-like protein
MNEVELIQLFINLPFAAVITLFIWFILKPLTEDYIKRKKNGKGYETHELQEKVKKLQDNEVKHLQADLREIRDVAIELRNEFGRLREEFYKLRDRVLILETKIKK